MLSRSSMFPFSPTSVSTGVVPVGLERAGKIALAELPAYRQTWRERADVNHTN